MADFIGFQSPHLNHSDLDIFDYFILKKRTDYLHP
ncbi:uncharacterized protein METZ01_LOCUS174626 [marine metagenome]|uniref:Uncharacterized protein n=1 Tax=marine metagenome TaxID=408172 RepID=A0A382C7K2_9ZZZZ